MVSSVLILLPLLLQAEFDMKEDFISSKLLIRYSQIATINQYDLVYCLLLVGFDWSFANLVTAAVADAMRKMTQLP